VIGAFIGVAAIVVGSLAMEGVFRHAHQTNQQSVPPPPSTFSPRLQPGSLPAQPGSPVSSPPSPVSPNVAGAQRLEAAGLTPAIVNPASTTVTFCHVVVKTDPPAEAPNSRRNHREGRAVAATVPQLIRN